MLIDLDPSLTQRLGLLGEGRVLTGEFLGGADVLAESVVLVPGSDDGAHLGVPLVQLLRQALVRMRGRVGEAPLQLFVLDDERRYGFEHGTPPLNSATRKTSGQTNTPVMPTNVNMTGVEENYLSDSADS